MLHFANTSRPIPRGTDAEVAHPIPTSDRALRCAAISQRIDEDSGRDSDVTRAWMREVARTLRVPALGDGLRFYYCVMK